MYRAYARPIDEPPGIIPRGDLDVSRPERAAGVQCPGEHPVRLGRGEAEEVATEVDRDPSAGARVLERIPACGVHARRERPPVEKRPGHVVAERGGGRIEPQHDRVVEQFDGDEADGGVEWRRRIVEKIGHGSRS